MSRCCIKVDQLNRSVMKVGQLVYRPRNTIDDQRVGVVVRVGAVAVITGAVVVALLSANDGHITPEGNVTRAKSPIGDVQLHDASGIERLKKSDGPDRVNGSRRRSKREAPRNRGIAHLAVGPVRRDRIVAVDRVGVGAGVLAVAHSV